MNADHFFDAISPDEYLLEKEVIYDTVESMDSNEPLIKSVIVCSILKGCRILP